jgi:hypothetical protein
MPKLIVLFFGAESPVASLAESAAQGAKAVRFMEVEVRAGAPHQETTDQSRKSFAGADDLRQYDGVILACSAGPAPRALDDLLSNLESGQAASGALANTIFAAIVEGGDAAALVGRLAHLGGILVSEPRGAGFGAADPEAHAFALGRRTAQVVEWVRHALSHDPHGHGNHHH